MRQRLVGREQELAAIADELTRARGRAGRLVVVEGPAGRGKSTLLAAALAAADAAGWHVRAGRGTTTARAEPLAVVRQVLPDVELPDDGDLDQVVGSLVRDTAAAVEGTPTVIAVDDLHWADPASQAWFAAVAAMADDLEVVLAGTVRTGDPGAAVVASLPEPHLLVAPAPLSEQEIAALAGDFGFADAHPDFVAACRRAAGGNPLYLTELFRELGARGLAGRATDAEAVGTVHSATVAEYALRRVDALSPAARRLVEAVAVLGDDVPLARAAAVAELDVDTATAAVGDLVVADVLAGAASRVDAPGAAGPDRGHALSFVHPIVRLGIERGIADPEAVLLHGRAVEVLRTEGLPPAVLGPHLLRLEPAGDAVVARGLRDFAEVARRRGDPRTAARAARRGLVEPAPPDLATDLHLELARALRATADEEAVPAYEAAAGAAPDDVTGGRITLELVDLLTQRGERERAAALALAGETEVPALAAEFGIAFVTAARLVPELAPTVKGRLAAIHAGTEPARDPAQRLLLAWLSLDLALAGRDRPTALTLAERAGAGGEVVEAEGAGSPSLSILTGTLAAAGEVAADIHLCDLALADARRTNAVLPFATVSYTRGAARRYVGPLSDAIADFDQAIALERRGWRLYLPTAHALRADCLLEVAPPSEARAALAAIPDGWQDSVEAVSVKFATGRLRLVEGDAAGALIDLRVADAVCTAAGMGPQFLPYVPFAAVAAAAAGDEQAAHDLVERDREDAERWGSARAVGLHHWATGVVTDDPDELAEAVRVLGEGGERTEQVRSLLALGGALARRDDLAGARDRFRQAIDVATAISAAAQAERALAGLVAAGGRPRRLPGRSPLTPTQRRVAEHLATGATTVEIADAMFVTPKAIERHVSAIYRALGISSRTEFFAVWDRPRPA